MESAVRHLREGVVKEDGLAPLMIFVDQLDATGGRSLVNHLLVDFCTALAQGRAQARQLQLVACQQPPSHYTSLLQPPLAAQQLAVVDGYSDPWGWLADCGQPPPAAPQGVSASVRCSVAALRELLLPQAAAAAAAGAAAAARSTALFIDSLDALLIQSQAQDVLLLLHHLRQQPSMSCVLATVQAHLHKPHALAGLEHSASCWVHVRPATSAEQDIARSRLQLSPHGRVDFRHKRWAGRVKADICFYAVTGPSSVALQSLPPGMSLTSQALLAAAAAGQAPARKDQRSQTVAAGTAPAAAAVAAAPAPRTREEQVAEELMRQMGGGMRLSLTEQEKAAKDRVVLPYEQVAASALATGAEPAAAGGALGQILYVRDSEEELDSDEDPDEDLDF